MEGIRTFLESSTIHGLTYISSTRKYGKAFWILVVIAGFATAGYLIHSSFESWYDSPIKTTVETLPISDIKFPKVTVCPPKNTYTDLNYDLMKAENITLTEEMSDELIDYSKKIINQHVFMDDLDILQEEDRYYNYYFGFSRMKRPDFETYSSDPVMFNMETSAISGVVTAQYFNEKFNPNLVVWSAYNSIYVNPPESVRNNTNVTLHFNVEKLSMIEVIKSEGWDNYWLNSQLIDHGVPSASMNFTPPTRAYFGSTRLRIPEEVRKNMEMEAMPGFRFSWYYSGLGDHVTPDPLFSEDSLNQLFIQ